MKYGPRGAKVLHKLTGFPSGRFRRVVLGRSIINGEASFDDDSSELCKKLREEDEVSKPLVGGSVGVDVIETGVIGSPTVGLLKQILLLGIGVSTSPDICGIDCRTDTRRGLAFNCREYSRAIRWSSSIDA